jgi:hypothetical protein
MRIASHSVRARRRPNRVAWHTAVSNAPCVRPRPTRARCLPQKKTTKQTGRARTPELLDQIVLPRRGPQQHRQLGTTPPAQTAGRPSETRSFADVKKNNNHRKTNACQTLKPCSPRTFPLLRFIYISNQLMICGVANGGVGEHARMLLIMWSGRLPNGLSTLFVLPTIHYVFKPHYEVHTAGYLFTPLPTISLTYLTSLGLRRTPP